MKFESVYAIVMAGGRGERFWPKSRKNCPKQLLSFITGQTMLNETVLRLFPLIKADNILVITNNELVKTVQGMLPIPDENIIGEPEGRDTAPCVALATAIVRRRNPDATLIFVPADHIIHPIKRFQQILASMIQQAQDDCLVTLGILPHYPATCYGYIQKGIPVGNGFLGVHAFCEKPDNSTAKRFLETKEYLWNSGIFIWRADTISKAFRQYSPKISALLEAWVDGKDFRDNFKECPKISIDYAVMEKANNVVVYEGDIQWNDVGNWGALRDLIPHDANENVTRGQSITVDSTNNILVCDEGNMLAVVGVQNMIVVQSGDGILVCPVEKEQMVKEVVRQLPEKWQ